MMEWHITAGDNSELSNACQRVIDIGETIKVVNFRELYEDTKTNATFMLEFMTEYHPTTAEKEADKIKGLLPFKKLSVAVEIEALQKDGYFQ